MLGEYGFVLELAKVPCEVTISNEDESSYTMHLTTRPH